MENYNGIVFIPTKRQEMRVVLAGLDGSGKTTLARLLVTGTLSEHAPTERVRVDKVLVGKTVVSLVDSSGDVDIGGRRWLEYDADGYIFVIDGADRLRLPEVETELKNILKRRIPVAILLNKSDMVTFCPVPELTQALHLEECNAEILPPLQAFECSLAKGLGFQEAIQWLLELSS